MLSFLYSSLFLKSLTRAILSFAALRSRIEQFLRLGANTLAEGNLRPRSEVEVLGDYLAYVHAKNTAFFCEGEISDGGAARKTWSRKTVPPSGGALDWQEVFFALKAGGFSGVISSEEYFTPENTRIISEGIAFLKECEKHAPCAAEPPFTSFND